MKKTSDLAKEEDSMEAKEAILVDDILSKTFFLILKQINITFERV